MNPRSGGDGSLGLQILLLLIFAGTVSYATWRANRTGEMLGRISIDRREDGPVGFQLAIIGRWILVGLTLLSAGALAFDWFAAA
jgi:hypothetical protein